MKKFAKIFRKIEIQHIKFFILDAVFAVLFVLFSCLPLILAVKLILLICCFIGLTYMTTEIYRMIKNEIYFSGVFDGMEKQEMHLQSQIDEMNDLITETQLMLKGLENE